MDEYMKMNALADAIEVLTTLNQLTDGKYYTSSSVLILMQLDIRREIERLEQPFRDYDNG